MKNSFLILLALFAFSVDALAEYPSAWWKEVSENDKKSWEILPSEAAPGEVILSKRTELGVFSNLGHSPFELEGNRYESVEGLWQALKYPDPKLKNDPRNNLGYPYTRKQIYLMHGFQSKKAGDLANQLMKLNDIKFVSYKGKKFDYKDLKEGSEFHYKLIYKAIKSKIEQNKSVRDLLLKTKGLVLRPDHKLGSNKPKSYYYHKILMEIRESL